MFSLSLDVYPGMGLLGHMVLTVLFLVFWGTSILFYTVTTLIYISTNDVQVFPFLYILSTFIICGLFDDKHSDRCEMISHSGFDFHVSDDWWCWASFHVSVEHLWSRVFKIESDINYIAFLFIGHLCWPGQSSQSSGFSSSHLWMWELDYKESWAPKSRCFWTVVLEKTLESPLDCKKIKAVHLKGDQS